jgi:hypothetical protein
MSEIKTDKIIPVDAGGTSTLGCTGDTIATGAGTTLNIQGTYSGINSINWDTTAKTTNFTAETNRGYFINTTSGSVTISLPATPVAGSFIGIKDYALTAQTNNIIINPNGNKIQGSTENFKIVTQGGAANLVYVDSTQGWLTYDAAQASDIAEGPTYICATGGTITTCGDFKIHTFTGPGTFTVCSVGNPAGSDTVDYLVIAGGGSAGSGNRQSRGSGAGGGGGYRESHCSANSGCYTASPLATSTGITVTATAYPITVGGGGAAPAAGPNNIPGNQGASSVFSTITSAGGGGGQAAGGAGGTTGGSGGGGRAAGLGTAGNTPPVSPPQGNPGGDGGPASGSYNAGGGGGATVAGQNGPVGTDGGNGGGTQINPAVGESGPSCLQYFSGGGAGGGFGPAFTNGIGGLGGGADRPQPVPSTWAEGIAATANTGGGGSGTKGQPGQPATGTAGGAGGSGIVIIRYRYQ